MTGGTIKPGNRDFAVSEYVSRQYDGITAGPGELRPKWKPKIYIDKEKVLFFWNPRPGKELTEEEYAHNQEILQKLYDLSRRGIEK